MAARHAAERRGALTPTTLTDGSVYVINTTQFFCTCCSCQGEEGEMGRREVADTPDETHAGPAAVGGMTST